jgi:hypothetical protein
MDGGDDFFDLMDECDEALVDTVLPHVTPTPLLHAAEPTPTPVKLNKDRPCWQPGKVESAAVEASSTAAGESAPVSTPAPSARAVDADDIMGFEFDALLAAGTHTAAEIESLKAQKRHREELYVCKHIIQSQAWETDPSCSEKDVHLCYAAALDGLNRSAEAMALLRGREEYQCRLALAKLLFKAPCPNLDPPPPSPRPPPLPPRYSNLPRLPHTRGG